MVRGARTFLRSFALRWPDAVLFGAGCGNTSRAGRGARWTNPVSISYRIHVPVMGSARAWDQDSVPTPLPDYEKNTHASSLVNSSTDSRGSAAHCRPTLGGVR